MLLSLWSVKQKYNAFDSYCRSYYTDDNDVLQPESPSGDGSADRCRYAADGVLGLPGSGRGFGPAMIGGGDFGALFLRRF
jgi:hypothetical protein